MTPDQVFLVATYGIMPFWVLLAVAPNWKWTQTLVHSALIPVVIGIGYTSYVATGAFSAGGDGPITLRSIMDAFQVPEAAVAGWLHYIVFDLFVGAWEARDANRRGISRWLVLPCLFFTLMLGPFGLLLYLGLRVVTRKGGWALNTETQSYAGN